MELKNIFAKNKIGNFLEIKLCQKRNCNNLLKMTSSGMVSETYEKYVHPDFRHHNAYYKGDRETLLKGMEENAKLFPNKTYETLRALEDGKLVAVHGKVTLAPDKIFSVIHIFRFEGDKIIEEWEASQQLLKDSPNKNGIF